MIDKDSAFGADHGCGMTAFQVTNKKPFHAAVEKVAETLKISKDDILNRVKSPLAIKARTVISKHLRNEYGYSYPQIGRMFGMHHSTIMYYVKGNKK